MWKYGWSASVADAPAAVNVVDAATRAPSM
jgi:hypothetical protein